MIINGNNAQQCNILTNKCFYQTTADIMRYFEQKGYANAADETAKVIVAYHSIMQKKSKNSYNQDYKEAFKKIDNAIKNMANKVFYIHNNQSYPIVCLLLLPTTAAILLSPMTLFPPANMQK